MVHFVVDFPARRYHATPWGHHVNEGLVEWPPSPWRILRALLATGYTKLCWRDVPAEMRELVEALARREPTYRLPPATQGHTRHYMPVKGLKGGVQVTSLVIDAFVRPAGLLGVEWNVDITPTQRALLASLLDRLSYLGRAESRVRAALVSGPVEPPSGILVSTHRQEDDADPVRLLAPVTADAYEAWRQQVAAAPEDLLAALQADTNELQKGHWSAPPGSRELVYWRPVRALSAPVVRAGRNNGKVVRADTALFALATDTRRDVLPLIERALPTMDLFRRALLSHVGDEQMRGQCPELTGKDQDGQPLRDGAHRHAHFIPLTLDVRNRGRIDHLLVYASMGFQATAQRALRHLRKTWAKGMGDISATLVGLGGIESFRRIDGDLVPELAGSSTWVSRTPFVPPRYIKGDGGDSIAGQVEAELRRRGLPGLAVAPIITLPNDHSASGRQARQFRHFVRTRRGGTTPPPPGSFHVRLTLKGPIRGPLCLGWGCHFGLGSFVPSDRAMTDEAMGELAAVARVRDE